MSEPVTSLDRSTVAALIPAYREAGRIGAVVKRSLAQLNKVLVIDDGSPDETSEQARAAGAEVIRHEKNQGKGAAIKTGLAHLSQQAQIEYIVLLDGDGQHLPEEIPAFLEEVARNPSPMIVGNRMSDLSAMPLVRKLTNLFMSGQISGVCGQKIPDTQCGFRLIRRDLIGLLAKCESSRYDFESEMLVMVSRGGWRIGAVPVSTVYGDEKSKIHPVQDTIRFFKLMRRLKQSQPERTA